MKIPQLSISPTIRGLLCVFAGFIIQMVVGNHIIYIPNYILYSYLSIYYIMLLMLQILLCQTEGNVLHILCILGGS